MSKRVVRVLITVVLLSPALWAQGGLPDPLTGNAQRPTLSGDTQATNILTTTLRFSAEVDDNALNDNSNKLTDVTSRFDPTFRWDLTRRRWSMFNEYTPGVSYSMELPRYRTVSHAVLNSITFMLAQHTTLRMRNQFLRTSDPFDRMSQFQTGPGFGVLDQSNPAYLGRPTLYMNDQAGADLWHQPAAHTTLGVSGSYATTMYEDLVPGAAFNRDTHVAGGRAFIDQKVSPQQSVSVSYNYSVITAGVYGRTASHSVLLFDSWRLNPKVSLSLFGGPQYTTVRYGSVASPLPLTTGWSWSAGGTIGWHGEMTGLTGSIVRRVSDSGGLGGAVQMTSISAGLTRRLGRSWTMSLAADYTINGSNAISAFDHSITYLSASAGVSRQIVRNVSFDARYWYSHEDRTNGISPIAFLADHNRFTVGISYSFTHRMGM